MLRRLNARRSSYAPRPAQHVESRRRGRVLAAAVRPAIESLERRLCLTVTLPTGFAATTVASGFGEPTDMAAAPDGRIFITEKAGSVRVIDHGVLQPTPFLTLAVDTYRDRGLDAITLDPNFASNGYVYVYYTAADPTNPNTAPNRAVNRLSRFQASPSNPDVALPGSEKTLIDNIPTNTGYHIGGFLDFGAGWEALSRHRRRRRPL